MVPKLRQKECDDLFRDGIRYIENGTPDYRLDGEQLLFIGVQKCGHCPEKCEHYHKAVRRLSEPKPVSL
ncbi:MAG: hypothetical protein V3V26_01405 [Candidatus Aenigmarchaeota archaeon]